MREQGSGSGSGPSPPPPVVEEIDRRRILAISYGRFHPRQGVASTAFQLFAGPSRMRTSFARAMGGGVGGTRQRCPLGASIRGLLDKVCVTARVPGGRARGERASERGVSSGRFLVGRRARAQRASGPPAPFWASDWATRESARARAQLWFRYKPGARSIQRAGAPGRLAGRVRRARREALVASRATLQHLPPPLEPGAAGAAARAVFQCRRPVSSVSSNPKGPRVGVR